MFIDYLGVMLVNLGAGLALLAHYVYVRPAKEARKSWAAGFYAVGLLGLLTALPLTLTWPLPGGFNVAYGEPGLYFATLFIAAGLTLPFEWEPLIPAIYGFFGAIYAVVIGIRIQDLHLGSHPTVALLGFVLTGIGGMLVLPTMQWRNNKTLALITAVILGLAAIIWLYTGYDSGWAHILDFAKWVPK